MAEGKPRVLIVEDEWIIANDIKDSLIEMGYRVSGIASSYEDAITAVSNEAPDLVLMDIVLKGDRDGIDTAREIHRKFGLPVIYLTAYVNEYLVEKAKVSEHFGYLVKPFRERELDIAIRMALHKANPAS